MCAHFMGPVSLDHNRNSIKFSQLDDTLPIYMHPQDDLPKAKFNVGSLLTRTNKEDGQNMQMEYVPTPVGYNYQLKYFSRKSSII